MRLKDHVDLAKAALPGSRQRGANLGGMMAVVVDYADPRGLAAQLETPVHAAEFLQGHANVIRLDIEADSHRNGRRRVQNVVRARHVQAELTQSRVHRRSPENGSPAAGHCLTGDSTAEDSSPDFPSLM